MPKEIRLAIWIVLFVLVVLAFLFWIIYPIILKKWMRKHPKQAFYKKIIKIANYRDYYLINEFKVHPEDEYSPSVDHLLLGNKYIYLIYDYYFEGAVDASLEDDYWIYHKMDKTKVKITNPIKKSKKITEYFAVANSIDPAYMVTIVLINNDCFISPIKNASKKENLVTLSKLEKLINSYESQDIGNFDEKGMNRLIELFAEKKNNARNKEEKI